MSVSPAVFGANGDLACPGFDSQALLNGDEPKAEPRFAGGFGKVNEPDRILLGPALVGVSRLAADEAVCRSAGRDAGVVGYAGDRADVRTGVGE